jgi:hypothetical protein
LAVVALDRGVNHGNLPYCARAENPLEFAGRLGDVSHVIAKHQLLWMWLQIRLRGQIRHVQHAHMMTHERERDDKRNETAAVVGDRLGQFRFEAASSRFLK